MLLSLIAVSVVLAGWSLLARRLEAWRLTAPMVLVLAGIAVGFGTRDQVSASLNTDAAEHIAEVILAILLFVDATDVRGGLFGREPGSALRMLFIVLPLSLGAALLLGLWLLPGLSWAVLLILACIVVPIDFAPATSILRDRRIPERVRNLLNVEAGYNDGIVSPIFIFALLLAGEGGDAENPLAALGSAVPQAIKAILVGLAVGAALALLSNRADRHGLMTDHSKRWLLVAAPLMAFGLSLGVDGNGFVAAFVCGLALRTMRHSADIGRELELVDDVGFLLAVGMWFVFGAAAVVALQSGVSIGMVVFCVLALTVVRVVPMLLGLLGARPTWRERWLLGALGPRGTTSIVFGLLAFNTLSDTAEHEVLLAMVITVLGSVVLHGLGAPAVARAHARSGDREHSAPGD